MEVIHYIIAIGGGFLAGVINTLSGYGSIITLSIMMEVLGLPSTIANATNRVNVLANSIGGIAGFSKEGKLDLVDAKSIISIVTIGAIFGAVLAINISNELFREIFKYLVVVLFLMIIVNPKRWLIEDGNQVDLPLWKLILMYFPIGFYGGFIQMGAGLFFLMAAVLVSRYSMIKANAIKMVVIFGLTIIPLIMFVYHDLVVWWVGGIVAIGQIIGSYLTAIYFSKFKNANLIAYRLLVVVVLLVILKTFLF